LRGQSLSAAIDILAGSNLQLSGTAQPDDTCAAQPNSAVIAQSLPPGDVPQHSNVILAYCSGHK
jgi:hypothetical protein